MKHIFKIFLFAWLLTIGTVAASHARDVTLAWTSTDSTVTGYKVYYKADSATLPFNGTGSTSGASPLNVGNIKTATVAGLDPNRVYYFAITAYNASGVESVYSNVVSVLEGVAPTVSITSPAANASATGTVSVTATATDNVGVSKVEFYVNGVLAATDTATPYLYSWNTATLATGTYTLMAKAYDAAGNVGQSSTVSVSVVRDTTAPTVSLTAPAANSTLSGMRALTASATDNVGVSQVEFYANGTLLSATNVAPYSYNWNTASVANGSYTLMAKAYDNAGNLGQSANVTVTVNNSVADATPPTVSLTAPSNGATVSGTAAVSSSATDTVGVIKVELYVNGALQATDTASPYTFSWNTTSVANGSYTLTAKAYDAAGNVGQSSTVSVTVNNAVAPPAPAGSTIWPDSTVPAVVDAGPDGNVELGVKFRSDTSGYITGIRFYKATANTGTHVGNLWTSTGTLLATATFTNETASGWQQVNFSAPVAISANTVYVASYHTTPGHFSVDRNYFTGTGMDTAPLHALASGVSGSNGVYAYGSTSVFPNQSYMDSNYWVDVAFTATGSSDTTPPTVTAFSMPSASNTLTVPIATFTATDGIGVTGYMINESVTAPLATASGWSATPQASYTFATSGSKTLYAWAKDAAGNVSANRSATVTVTLTTDTTLPTVGINSPAPGSRVRGNVTISAAASDNVGVTRMELYIDNVLKATAFANGLTWAWNTNSYARGSHVIKVNAFDAANNMGTKAITVNR